MRLFLFLHPMRAIKLYIATSLDNYIARADGAVDWLEAFPTPEGEDFGYADFTANVDQILTSPQYLTPIFL